MSSSTYRATYSRIGQAPLSSATGLVGVKTSIWLVLSDRMLTKIGRFKEGTTAPDVCQRCMRDETGDLRGMATDLWLWILTMAKPDDFFSVHCYATLSGKSQWV
ncbi:hypothetical protein Nepgr_025697 [Nepenthes gracilis]|uniref:Uncharacterized protein n=1 Tax=Nepenthes gracilis TaxID=150966 RepID=A0AAD3T7C4_NEPGR|nr:hypothetical protein Nepgr_025697 [Nepenthes gracilis]